MNVTFVTGNANKAKYFSEFVGLPINHQSVDAVEIQSLDLVEIAECKAKAAYSQLKSPVIVEDAAVSISSMGRLPGPFIKWFVDEIGLEQICRLADWNEDRSAIASDVIAYYDGKILRHFVGSLSGSIAKTPKGGGGYDWDKIFIPHFAELTMAEMDEKSYREAHLQIKPIEQMKDFLSNLDNN